MSNPYEPPRSSLNGRNTEPGSLPKAIAIGLLIDICGTFLLSITALIVYRTVLSLQGYSDQEIQGILEQFEPWSAFGLFISFLGMLVSAVAGYHCARIANRNTYLAPGILAMISCAFGAAVSAGAYSQVELIVLSGLTVVAVLGGASLYIRRWLSGS